MTGAPPPTARAPEHGRPGAAGDDAAVGGDKGDGVLVGNELTAGGAQA